MTVGRICCREVDTADPGEPAKAAAQRMDTRGVGTLVVLDSKKHPVGILTDRDLALRIVGRGADPLTTRIDEIMTKNVQTVFEEMPIEEALALMRSQTVRRLIVVARDGALVGIVSLDDVLALLAEEFRDVGELLERESPRVAAAVS